jgi:hypothetical protein
MAPAKRVNSQYRILLDTKKGKEAELKIQGGI